MLLREIVAPHVGTDSRILLGDDEELLADRLDRWTLGSLRDGTCPTDVVVTRVSNPLDVVAYWPADLPVGARVVVVIDRGIGEVPVSRAVQSANAVGLAIVDSIEVSDVGTASLAIIAKRTDRPVAPVSWLTGGLHSLVHDDETRIKLAVGAHVLSRSVDTQRSDTRFARLHQIKRERDLLAARVERLEKQLAQKPPLLPPADYARIRRRLAAIERSRTWRVGRFFWTLRHPIRAMRGRTRELPSPTRLESHTLE